MKIGTENHRDFIYISALIGIFVGIIIHCILGLILNDGFRFIYGGIPFGMIVGVITLVALSKIPLQCTLNSLKEKYPEIFHKIVDSFGFSMASALISGITFIMSILQIFDTLDIHPIFIIYLPFCSIICCLISILMNIRLMDFIENYDVFKYRKNGR